MKRNRMTYWVSLGIDCYLIFQILLQEFIQNKLMRRFIKRIMIKNL